MIETTNLGKVYGNKDILKQVTVQVNRGEIFGIIGPSGAGKSTFLRLLDLIEKPSSGYISILGEDVTSSKDLRFRFRRRMAMLFQKPVVFSKSVEENIALGLKYRGEDSADIDRKVTTALNEIGLAEYRTRRATTLSGGEAQRVALARAMVTDPEILFLDEPTANLDPHSTEKIEELVVQMNRESGTTVVLCTHNMLQGQKLANRMGVMIGGELQQIGTTKDIFHKPHTREIAHFVGMENILPGTLVSSNRGEVGIDINGTVIHAVSALQPGNVVNACFRAEDVTIDLAERSLTSALNVFHGTVSRLVPTGPFVEVTIDCGFPIMSLVTIRSAEDLQLSEGREVWASFKATAIHVLQNK